MKKILIVIIFSGLLLTLNSCGSKNSQVDMELNNFINEISIYESYNPNYLHQYFDIYQKYHSYIYALNYINYPLFLSPNNSLPAITIDDCILVNRYFYLEEDYQPKTLVKVENVNYVKRVNEVMMLDKTVFDKYKEMEIFLKQKDINLLLFSAFRSYEKQNSLWKNNQQINELYLAKPGYSEHQTGLSIDIGTKDSGLTIHFENTHAFKVLKDNAHLFGFILRYPKEKEEITGYAYEPWHFRYVGPVHAKVIYENNLTLEEYFYNYFVLNY